MRQARVLPLLGPVLVLYLIADAASGSSGLDLGAWAVSLSALAASILPLLVRRQAVGEGTRRVQLLGVALGLSVLPLIASSLALEIARIGGLTLAAAILLDLSLGVPDAPRVLDRGPLGRLVPTLVAVVLGLLATLAILPPEAAGHVLVPAHWADAPDHLLFAAMLLALGLRLSRRSLGSTPEALARNAWPLFGLSVALVATGVDRVVWATGLPLSPTIVRSLPVITALAVTASHVPLVDDRRGPRSGETIRQAITWTLTLATVGALASLFATWQPTDAFGVALAAMLLVVLGTLLHRVLGRLTRHLFAPFGGRLLVGIADAEARLGRVSSVVELGRSLLPPLRDASDASEASPLLFAVDPALEIRVDRAGEAHVRAQPLPEALRERMLERPGEVLVRKALESLVVRRPGLRGVVDALVSLDALAAVPLSIDGELEGAIIVPRGRRRSAPALEELRALEGLADRVSGLVALLAAERRAQGRAGDGDVQQRDLADRIEVLEEERNRLRAEARQWKAGRPAHRMSGTSVAYSASMRSLMSRVNDIGSLDAPVLLDAEGGAAVDQVAHAIHAASGRHGGPLVVADCAAVRAERAGAALFGEVTPEDGSVRPGWLSLARGGSLLLADVVALPLSVQHDLAEALAEREVRPVGGSGAEPIDVRVIAASRVALAPLVKEGVFDPELARWLSPLTLEVPALRNRVEDLPSLTLLALDRACRLLGRSPMGIEDAALDMLRTHDWPGNVRELTWTITRAVAGATGTTLAVADLPGLNDPDAPDEEAGHPLDGTWAELERRILVRALETAEGNKSEASRLLGLKRTTFLDKLRRHELAPPAKSRESNRAAAS